MQYNPAAFDRVLDPGEVLSGRAFILEEKRAVYLLDMDAAVLNDFDASGLASTNFHAEETCS